MDHQQEGDYPVLLRGSGKAAHIESQHGLTLAESIFYGLRYIRAPLREADHVVKQLAQSPSRIDLFRGFLVVERHIAHFQSSSFLDASFFALCSVAARRMI